MSNAEPYSISAGEGPSHSFNAVNTQLYRTSDAPAAGTIPTMDGFVQSYRDSLQSDHVQNPTADQIAVVMQAFAPGTLPALEALADNFTLCDNWFCEVPGPTMPNRMFIHMASSGGYIHNVWDHTFDQPTIYNRIEDAGKTWATYSFDQNEVKQFSQVNQKTACFKDFDTSFQADLNGGPSRTMFLSFRGSSPRMGRSPRCTDRSMPDPATSWWLRSTTSCRSSPVWDNCPADRHLRRRTRRILRPRYAALPKHSQPGRYRFAASR